MRNREALDVLHQPIMQNERVWYREGDYENMRIPRPQPAKRFEEYYNILWKLCELEDSGG